MSPKFFLCPQISFAAISCQSLTNNSHNVSRPNTWGRAGISNTFIAQYDSFHYLAKCILTYSYMFIVGLLTVFTHRQCVIITGSKILWPYCCCLSLLLMHLGCSLMERVKQQQAERHIACVLKRRHIVGR